MQAERWGAPPITAGTTGHGEVVKVTEAEVVLVAVNEQGRPVPIRPEAPTAEYAQAASPVQGLAPAIA